MKKCFFTAIACMLIVYGFAQPDNDSIRNTAIDVSDKVVKAEAILYPNPAKNKISLQVEGFDPGMIALTIIDMNGAPVKEENRLLINGNDEEIILFFFLQPGIYFILLHQNQKWVRKKMMVVQ